MAPPPDYTLVGQGRRLDLLGAIRRLHAELDAMEINVLAAMAADPDPYRGDPIDLSKQWVREDVACALRIPSVTAAHRLDVAVEVATRFPATLNAMWAADVSARYAERLVEATIGLPDHAATEVETAVLGRAGTETLAQFTRSVRRAAAEADPRRAEEQHAACRDQRRVVFTPTEHGMVEQWALLPADDAAAIRASVQALADSWKGVDDRTADQRRADALRALVTGTSVDRPAVAATVQVTVALSTLLGLDDHPADLDGHGPVPASVGRRIAFERGTTWRRLVLDGCGSIVDVSAQTYRPPAAMTRYVQLRDRTCQFPGCSRRAARCDLDHVRPWLVSRDTSPNNLICLCPRHHHLKHDAGWKISRDADRTVHWTNPTGRTYMRPPPQPPPF